MSWTRETWRKELASNLFELGNIALQQDLWLAKIPGYQSDFTEAINNLDSCGVPQSLDEFVSKGFITTVAASRLKSLDSLMEQTGEYLSKDDFEKLWKSVEWQKISDLALGIVKDFFDEELKNAGIPLRDWIHKYPL
jgi:hypothetical protein